LRVVRKSPTRGLAEPAAAADAAVAGFPLAAAPLTASVGLSARLSARMATRRERKQHEEGNGKEKE